MTKRILLIALSLISIELYAQDAKLLLQKSFSKCLTIKNGYYEMQKMMKFMDEKDIHVYGDYKFYFNKIKDDSLYTVAFNSKNYYNGEYFRNVLYTGNEYVTYSTKDSSAQIMSNERFAATIKRLSDNDIWNFYLPFTSEGCTPLPKASDYTDNMHIFKFIAKEIQNNMHSYHIQMIEYPKYDSTDVQYLIQTVYDYWINSEDMIPIKYSGTSKLIRSGDTLIGYSSHSLIKYDLNIQPDKNLMPLQLSSIPTFCNMQDYVETKKIELLNKDTSAPNWALTSVDDKTVSLADYNGKLIVMDFFYKNCLPCMKAVPVLKSIYEKYKSKGLVVVGIDPIDKKNEGIEHFISKQGISYKVLLDEKEAVAKQYNVSGYPTIYLIGKNGKVIYAHAGYDEVLEDKLEELIKSNL